MRAPEVNRYRRQQLEAMTPGQLVLVVYEQAILACRKGNRRRLRQAVEQLIWGLDFEQGEVADGLLLLYDWVLRQSREGDFAEAEKTLRQLRDTWKEALKIEQHARKVPEPERRGLPPDLTG